MSQFVTKLREDRDEQGQTGRDGINWPTPVGTWKQNEDVNRLETFANNLDVSQAPGDTDLLNSVPTPWARLLLFESALYKPRHPSHRDVEDQWRGLLGVLALAAPLRLNLSVRPITLSQYATQHHSRIAKTFIDLHPRYQTGDGDAEQGRWDNFQLILVDGTVLGATSPRTLVFTGVAHQCPSSVPFRTSQGRLSDPIAYYREFNDAFYLSLLSRWVGGFVSALEHNERLDSWMGAVPAAPGAAQSRRIELLLERLRDWQGELRGVAPADIAGGAASYFALEPYNIITSLPDVRQPGHSDLFARGRTDLLVCYRPEAGSKLVNAFNQELVNEPLRVYDGRWIYANQPLPLPLSFIPASVRRIEDPLALFEDRLIQIALPDTPEGVYDLSVGDPKVSQKRYLYPFKADILKYFSPAEIAANTTIAPNPQTNSLRVEFKIPVENNRTIKAAHEYPLDTGVIADTETVTAELVAWPDFTCSAWTRYFYFKTIRMGAGTKPVDFEPLVDSVSRGKSGFTWYATREPVKAFTGSVDGNTGLLLLRENQVETPTRFWKVGVDFGSTHTRAFAIQVEKHGDEKRGFQYLTSQDAAIQSIPFVTRARQLTYGDPLALRNYFMPLVGMLDPPVIEELKTLLMMPESGSGATENWLPREGFVYAHWIFAGDYDATRLRYNLKWNSQHDDTDLRAFLRCLLIMIQAEAIKQGARVVSVTHTYPSVFTEALIAKHNGEWLDLQSYLNLGTNDLDSRVNILPASMFEAVAVCRHLELEQQASPVTNTISLDVGGSTTDVAVWAQKRLEVQESVKLASGTLGRYLQSQGALDFLKWLEATLQSAPFNLKALSLSKSASKPAGYSLMFTNMLSFLQLRGHLPTLVNMINGAQEARRLMSIIIYLFGGLLYYAGLLARKAGLPQHQNIYYIYFCGKGGTLVEWIKGYEVLAQEMFAAGLFGPRGREDKSIPTVVVRISQNPKEEVGRGLLAESELQGSRRDEQIGLLDPNPPSVTVGDTGYSNLQWNGELSPQALRQLPDNAVPAMDEMQELSAFLSAFSQGRATKVAAAELKLQGVSKSHFRNRMLQRLFGAAKGSIISDIKKNDADALLEPLFITEIKVLLEEATRIEMFP